MAKKRKVKTLRQAPGKPVRQLAPTPRRMPAKAAPTSPAPDPRTEVRGEVATTTDPFLQKLSPEARAELEVREKMMEEVRKFVEENPEAASQLLRVWLSAGKGK